MKTAYYKFNNQPSFLWEWVFTVVVITFVSFLMWKEITKTPEIISPVPDEVFQSESVRRDYDRGMTQPISSPQQ